jgi:hypothetical protein
MLNGEVAAIIEPDPSGSGLYHSRLYSMLHGQEPIHEWIEPRELPLRQQVALIHEATRSLYRETLGSKDAPWLEEPASEKQVATLKRLYPRQARRIESRPMTKAQASRAITLKRLRRTLDHPPSSHADKAL